LQLNFVIIIAPSLMKKQTFTELVKLKDTALPMQSGVHHAIGTTYCMHYSLVTFRYRTPSVSLEMGFQEENVYAIQKVTHTEFYFLRKSNLSSLLLHCITAYNRIAFRVITITCSKNKFIVDKFNPNQKPIQ